MNQDQERFLASFRELDQGRSDRGSKSEHHERILARAHARFARHDFANIDEPPARAWWRPAVLLLAAATAGAALVLLGIQLGHHRGAETTVDMAAAPTPTRQQASDRIVSGELALAAGTLAGGALVPADERLSAHGPFVVMLAHARLSVARAESMVWSPATRIVTLSDATVDVSVDPVPHRSFRLTMPHFIVDVRGTEFRVDADRVSVTRGRVVVLSREHEAVLAELGPGESFTYLAPHLGVAPSESQPKTFTKEHAVGTDRSAIRADVLSPAQLLARARRHLAEGETRSARVDLAAALLGPATRAEQAKANMLQGDCWLIEGDSASAVRQYVAVSRRFADVNLAETALFSAARVESNSGHPASARDLLQSYVKRYPNGQFRNEARARLRDLDAK